MRKLRSHSAVQFGSKLAFVRSPLYMAMCIHKIALDLLHIAMYRYLVGVMYMYTCMKLLKLRGNMYTLCLNGKFVYA